MIGTTLCHPLSGITGTVDQIAGHPDGKTLVRIDDHWFMADECVTIFRVWSIRIAVAAVLASLLYAGLTMVA